MEMALCEKISKDDLIIDEVPIDGISVSSYNGIVVGININAEGINNFDTEFIFVSWML